MASLAVLLLAALPAAACDDQSSEEQLCNDLDDLAAAVKSILDIDPSNARDDLRQVREDIEDAMAGVRESAEDVPELQALEDAARSFTDAVAALPESADIGQSIRDLGTEFTNLTAALQDARDAVDCG